MGKGNSYNEMSYELVNEEERLKENARQRETHRVRRSEELRSDL